MDAIYTPLDKATNEIRILKIEPPNPEHDTGEISCTLTTAALASAPAYEALSYAWGSPERTHAIKLNGQSFPVTENLYVALKHLRLASYPHNEEEEEDEAGDEDEDMDNNEGEDEDKHILEYHDDIRLYQEFNPSAGILYEEEVEEEDPQPLKTEYIWIDAICIQQCDNDERTHQVFMMGEIYKRAQKVIIWLGAQAEGSNLALNIIKRSAPKWKKERERVKLQKKLIRYHRCITKLLRRPYWRRLWVVQEVSLPSADPVIMCGKKWISYSKFDRGLGDLPYTHVMSQWPELQKMIGHIGRTIRGIRESLHSPDIPRLRGMHIDPHTNMIKLLSIAREMECMDPHDRIYSLLDLFRVHDYTVIKIPHITPDYTKSVHDSFAAITKAVIHLEGDLEVLHMRNHTAKEGSLPSWCPDYTIPETKGYTYPAWYIFWEKRPNSLETMDIRQSDLAQLSVQGEIVGYVVDVVDLNNFDANPLDCFRRVHDAVAEERKPPYPKTGESHESPLWYASLKVFKLFSNADLHDDRRGYIKLVESLNSGQITEDPDLEAFIRSASEVISHRAKSPEKDIPHRTFIISDDGLLGLGPPECTYGDILCNLTGFNAPAVLRYASERHTFVGSVYLEEHKHWVGKQKPEEFILH